MAFLLPVSLIQYFDNNGNPAAGALCHVYLVGTTTDKNTYTTSALSVANSNPLEADSSGRFGLAYIDDGETYKLVITDATGGTTFYTADNLSSPPSALNTAITRTYESKSSDYVVVAGDANKMIDFDASAASRTATLNSSTLGNGFWIRIGKSDSSGNTVVITPGGGQTIDGASTYPLDTQYESVDLISMGASGWRTDRADLEPLGEIAINDQTGTTYTFVYSDKGKYHRFTNAFAITVTVPANASVPYPIGTRLEAIQGGAGEVTFAAAGGVTINSVSSWKDAVAQYSAMVLTKVATNTWDLVGDIEA